MNDCSFNGINGATGQYLMSDFGVQDISKVIRGEQLDAEHLAELKWSHQRATTAHYGVREGIDVTDLAQAGWGVIFGSDSDPAIHEALQPLLEHRRRQISGKDPSRYREFAGREGYHSGEAKQQFLARHGVGPGPVDPKRMPYYLLLVGDPESIPFRFQYQLDVQYAVGRIHFDTLGEYAQYARSVVEAEQSLVKRPQRAIFFGVQNPGDRATKLSVNHLVKPLADSLEILQPSWNIRTCLAEEATKASLASIFSGSQQPSLLFTASHGMGFPNGDSRQLAHQGALLCQDWPGPFGHRGPIPEKFYFPGDDLSSEAEVAGLIAFFFACYGAGTPQRDDFAHQVYRQPVALAPSAFVAKLPQRLLGHPKGGALAVVGHVERAWGCSFLWPGVGRQVTVFEDVLTRIMSGHPIGSALEPMNERYAELSSDLSQELEEISFGKTPDDLALAGIWTANNDARSYIILGDPAVRVRPVLKAKGVIAD